MKLLEKIFPDYFSRSDRRNVLLALVLTIVASIILFVAKPPSRTKAKKTIAHLQSFSNNVRYKESGSVSFFEVVKNEELQNNDEVFTGEGSTANVQFLNSKTLLKIPSSSLVRIENGDNGDAIEVKDGLVDIVIRKDQTINIKADGLDHEIKASEAESVVKAYYSEGDLHFFTKDAGVKIKSADGENVLKSNSDSILKGSKVKVVSNFMLLSPSSGERVDLADGITIKTSQVSHYDLTLSKNVDFGRPFIKTEFSGTSFKWEPVLTGGDYFLKVADKEHSRVVLITLATKYQVDGLIPGDGDILPIDPGEKATLHWNAQPVSSYQVTVVDSQGKEIQSITNTNEFQLENLKGSDFSWSVAPEIAKDRYSTPSKKNKVKLKFNGKIELVNIPVKEKYKSSEEKINLSWKLSKGGSANDAFIIKMLDSKDNRELLSKELTTNQVDIPLKSNGAYKIEVSSVDYPSLEKAEFRYLVASSLLDWDPKLPKEIKSPEPVADIALKFKANTDFGKNADIHMSYTPGLGSPKENPIEKEIKIENAQKIRLAGFGQYCFKASLNPPVDYYSDSDNYCLNFIQVPLFAVVPRALDTVMSYVKHNGADSYKISVPMINKATRYQFEIYKDALGRIMIYQEVSKTPEIFWATTRTGIYYLKYKVYDDKNRGSDYSPISKIIFPVSPMSDW